MQLFYSPDIQKSLYLDENDSKHCIRVLRKEKGDTIHVVDGKGNFYDCLIADPNPKKCQLSISGVQEEFQKPSRKIHVAICPTKNADRIEYFVEKSVEIGISTLSFIKTTNSVQRKVNLDRITKIAVSAMKQSIKAYLPEIHEITDFGRFIAGDLKGQKLIAHLNDFSEPIQNKTIEQEVILLIGPEGDFTPEEIGLAIEKGFNPVSLGHSRLRTETAGVVGVSVLNLL